MFIGTYVAIICSLLLFFADLIFHLEIDWKWATPLFFVFVGWFVAHDFSSKRDRSNALRDIRIGYLIEAYRSFADLAGREEKDRSYQKVEQAIIDIQLFGTKKQIQEVHRLLDGAKNGTWEFDPITNLIRDALRKEISEDKLEGNLHWARAKSNS